MRAALPAAFFQGSVGTEGRLPRDDRRRSSTISRLRRRPSSCLPPAWEYPNVAVTIVRRSPSQSNRVSMRRFRVRLPSRLRRPLFCFVCDSNRRRRRIDPHLAWVSARVIAGSGRFLLADITPSSSAVEITDPSLLSLATLSSVSPNNPAAAPCDRASILAYSSPSSPSLGVPCVNRLSAHFLSLGSGRRAISGSSCRLDPPRSAGAQRRSTLATDKGVAAGPVPYCASIARCRSCL